MPKLNTVPGAGDSKVAHTRWPAATAADPGKKINGSAGNVARSAIRSCCGMEAGATKSRSWPSKPWPPGRAMAGPTPSYNAGEREPSLPLHGSYSLPLLLLRLLLPAPTPTPTPTPTPWRIPIATPTSTLLLLPLLLLLLVRLLFLLLLAFLFLLLLLLPLLPLESKNIASR